VRGVGEHGEVGDAFLEEVAGAFGDVLEQSHGVARLEVV
jgi:hypothetical protein